MWWSTMTGKKEAKEERDVPELLQSILDEVTEICWFIRTLHPRYPQYPGPVAAQQEGRERAAHQSPDARPR